MAKKEYKVGDRLKFVGGNKIQITSVNSDGTANFSEINPSTKKPYPFGKGLHGKLPSLSDQAKDKISLTSELDDNSLDNSIISPADYALYTDTSKNFEKPTHPYTLKRVNYHYTCENCSMPFEPVKTVSEMDEQVSKHDCDNLTNFEAHKVRKVLMSQMGYHKYCDAIEWKPEHENCKSYQTACVQCAEDHEMALYNFFTSKELAYLVRPDSMFYKPEALARVDMGNGVTASNLASISASDDIPNYQKWQYLHDKSGTQLELERKGINYGNHIDDDDTCRVCGQRVYDAYCMDCWSPSGYLLEED